MSLRKEPRGKKEVHKLEEEGGMNVRSLLKELAITLHPKFHKHKGKHIAIYKRSVIHIDKPKHLTVLVKMIQMMSKAKHSWIELYAC